MRNYSLQPGDTLARISVKFGIPVCMIIRANSGTMPLGRNIVIPDRDYCRYTKYVTSQGDTVWKVAEKCGLTYKDVMDAAGVARPQDMSPGRELKLPRRDGLKIYTVKATDTRDSLIFRYGRTVEEQLTGRGLYPGMQIYIKVPPDR